MKNPFSRLTLLLFLAFAGLFPTTAPADDLARGLVAWYRLDGRLVDESGNGHHGSLSTGTLAYDAGVYGQAFDADEATRVVVNDNAALRLTGSYTISFWMRLRSFGTFDFMRPISKLSGSTGYDIFTSSGGSVILRHNNNSGTQIAANGLVLDSWQFWTFSYDGTTAKSYRDAAVINTATIPAITSSTVDLFFFDRQGINRFLDGWVDNLTIHNRALAPHEIRQLYALGSPIGLAP